MQEHVANRDNIRATEEEKQKAEEEQRQLFLSAKEKMMKLRKDREAELLRYNPAGQPRVQLFHSQALFPPLFLSREAQKHRESIMKDLTVAQQEESASQEQRIAKAVEEQDAKQAQQWWEEAERRTAMLRSIREHRELTVPLLCHWCCNSENSTSDAKHMLNQIQEKEQRERAAKQQAEDELEAKREADRMFAEKQRSKAQQNKQDRRKLQDFNATLTVALILPSDLKTNSVIFTHLSSNPGWEKHQT